MNGHEVMWTLPPALLATPAARILPLARAALKRPANLRFNHDGIMDEFLGVLDTSPERLREYQVRRETWRGFTPRPVQEPKPQASLVLKRLGILPRRQPAGLVAPAAPPAESVPASTPLKLYQPAHQRHYLVACSLVCGAAGLPDRGVDAGRGEQIASVIRRLLPPAGASPGPVDGWDEYAWVPRPHGYVWQRVGTDPLQVLDDEERLRGRHPGRQARCVPRRAERRQRHAGRDGADVAKDSAAQGSHRAVEEPDPAGTGRAEVVRRAVPRWL
jgi:hypothetical protein